MAVNDRFTGEDLVVEFTPSGGTVATISGDFTNFAMNRTQDTVDVTAGAEAERSFLTTKKSLDWTLSAFLGDDDLAGTNLVEGLTGLMAVYPKGKVSGEPIRSFTAIITGLNESYPFDGAVEIEVSGVRTGAMINDIGDTYTP